MIINGNHLHVLNITRLCHIVVHALVVQRMDKATHRQLYSDLFGG